MKKKKHPTLPPMEPFDPYSLFGSNLNKMAKDFIRAVKSFYQKNDMRPPDTSDAIFKRRANAVVAFTDTIIDRYKNIPSYEPERRMQTSHLWISLNFTPSILYNKIESRSHILYAAAIWILDQITTQPDWRSKLFPLLPRNSALLDNLDAPMVWDPTYHYDLILSVMYVLYYRDIDIAPLEVSGDGVNHILTSSINACNDQHVAVPSRQTYEALIRLIPEKSVKQAAQDFESLFWAWTDRYFTCYSHLNAVTCKMLDTINEHVVRFNALQKEMNEVADEIDEERDKQRRQVRQQNPYSPWQKSPSIRVDNLLSMSAPFRPGSSDSILSQFSTKIDPNQRMDILLERYADALKDIEKHIEMFRDLEVKHSNFTGDMLLRGYIPPKECKKAYGEDPAAAMQPLVISNPYEICFALLWLIDSGSDLPWLTGPGCGMMQEVVHSLPWGIVEYDELEDPVWSQEGQTQDEEFEQGTIPDWYERRYTPKNYTTLPDFNRSLAQILYEETGCIMPRDMRKYSKRLEAIKGYGVKGKEPLALLYLFSALSQAQRQCSALNLDNAFLLADESKQDDLQLNNDKLIEQLRQAKEEIKRLRSSLHDYEHTVRETKKELSSVRDTASLEHRELADLRELVFNQQSEQEQEQTEDTAVTELPYEVVRRTVVFGGHDAWLKSIRTMLKGNIRFIDKDMSSFDTGIIRSADKIWIQPNVMSHRQYYQIIEAARLYRTPVRYFAHSSATKCAVQVMEDD